MRVIDAVGWIEYFVEGPLANHYGKYIEELEHVVTPTITTYEVYKKILRDAGELPAVEAVAHMRKTVVIPLTSELAISAAEYSLTYKLPTADAIVYATAQAEGAEVVTSDQHFRGLPGVEFIEGPAD